MSLKAQACGLRLCVRTHGKLCSLRDAICVLSYFIAGRSTGRSTQISARRPHGLLCVRTTVQAIAVMFINTQHASDIAENSVAQLVKIKRKLKYVKLGAACGLRQSNSQSSRLTHSTFRPACGKV